MNDSNIKLGGEAFVVIKEGDRFLFRSLVCMCVCVCVCVFGIFLAEI